MGVKVFYFERNMYIQRLQSLNENASIIETADWLNGITWGNHQLQCITMAVFIARQN